MSTDVVITATVFKGDTHVRAGDELIAYIHPGTRPNTLTTYYYAVRPGDNEVLCEGSTRDMVIRKLAHMRGVTSGYARLEWVTYSGPGRKGRDRLIDLSSKPRVRRSAPQAENSAPAAENSAPAAENSAPEAENSAPEAENSAPAAEDSPIFQIGEEETDADGRTIAVMITDRTGETRRVRVRPMGRFDSAWYPVMVISDYKIIIRQDAVYDACSRCGGSGWFDMWDHIVEGECFLCHGTGLAKRAMKALTFADIEKVIRRRVRRRELEHERRVQARERELERFEARFPGAYEAAQREIGQPRSGFTADVARRILALKATDRQVEAFMRVISELDARDAERQAAYDATPDIEEGRREITGVILSVKWDEYAYPKGAFKWLIQLPTGNKVYGRVPEALVGNINKGDTVRFTATVERSNKDAKFGILKRPCNAEIIARAESEAEPEVTAVAEDPKPIEEGRQIIRGEVMHTWYSPSPDEQGPDDSAYCWHIRDTYGRVYSGRIPKALANRVRPGERVEISADVSAVPGADAWFGVLSNTWVMMRVIN